MTARTIQPLALLAPLAGLAALTSGCEPAFDPYNELTKLRVLAVRADAPYLAPGEQATLDALTFLPARSRDAGTEVAYEWSWCPLTSGPALGLQCVLEHDALQALADASSPGGERVEVPPYALGTGATATFTYPAAADAVRALCDALREVPLPDLAFAPDCAGGFPISIVLVARAGDERVTAVKEVRLLYSADAPRNANPVLGGVTAARLAEQDTSTDPPATMPEDTPTAVARGARYALRLDLAEALAETFTPEPGPDEPAPAPRREQLTVTWFVEGGETDSMRTSFIDGEVPMEETRANTWTVPLTEEFAPEAASVYFVVRDGRGGVGWLERRVTLE